MSTVVLFPGQGTEHRGMGAALRAADPGARALMALASAACGADLEEVLARGGPQLARPSRLQPALVAHGLSVFQRLLAAGLHPRALAGHSLGLLTAAGAAGVLTPEETVRLAALRGAEMERAAAASPGGMFALLGTADEAGEACGMGLTLAAVNASEEWVLAGDHAALRRVAGRFRGTRLAVAGPWHTAAMASAAEALAAALDAIPSRPATFPVQDGPEVLDGPALRRRLVEQLTRPVRWRDTLTALAAAGGEATTWVVAGPLQVMRGLVRKNCGREAVVLHGEALP